MPGGSSNCGIKYVVRSLNSFVTNRYPKKINSFLYDDIHQCKIKSTDVARRISTGYSHALHNAIATNNIPAVHAFITFINQHRIQHGTTNSNSNVIVLPPSENPFIQTWLNTNQNPLPLSVNNKHIVDLSDTWSTEELDYLLIRLNVKELEHRSPTVNDPFKKQMDQKSWSLLKSHVGSKPLLLSKLLTYENTDRFLRNAPEPLLLYSIQRGLHWYSTYFYDSTPYLLQERGLGYLAAYYMLIHAKYYIAYKMPNHKLKPTDFKKALDLVNVNQQFGYENVTLFDIALEHTKDVSEWNELIPMFTAKGINWNQRNLYGRSPLLSLVQDKLYFKLDGLPTLESGCRVPNDSRYYIANYVIESFNYDLAIELLDKGCPIYFMSFRFYHMPKDIRDRILSAAKSRSLNWITNNDKSLGRIEKAADYLPKFKNPKDVLINLFNSTAYDRIYKVLEKQHFNPPKRVKEIITDDNIKLMIKQKSFNINNGNLYIFTCINDFKLECVEYFMQQLSFNMNGIDANGNTLPMAVLLLSTTDENRDAHRRMMELVFKRFIGYCRQILVALTVAFQRSNFMPLKYLAEIVPIYAENKQKQTLRNLVNGIQEEKIRERLGKELTDLESMLKAF